MDFPKAMDLSIFTSYGTLSPGSGIGLLAGITGSMMMVFSAATYVPRKRLESMHLLGPKHYWLDLHMVSGLFGACLVYFHAALSLLKVAGLANVAMWGTVASGILLRFFSMRVSETRPNNAGDSGGFWWKLHVWFSVLFGIYAGIHLLVVFLFKPIFVF